MFSRVIKLPGNRLGLCLGAVSVSQEGSEMDVRPELVDVFEMGRLWPSKARLVPPRQGTAGLQPGLAGA